MKKSEEQQVLKAVYENVQSAVRERKQGISCVFEEPLRLALWDSLTQWEHFAEKARNRLNEKDLEQFGYQGRKVVADPSDQQQERKEERLLQIFRKNREAAGTLKYAIHHWKHAGIYATELAKEIIDFQESEVENLKRYL